MKLKKLTACALSVMMIAGLAACSSDTDSSNNNTANGTDKNNTESSVKGEGEGFGTKEETVYVTTAKDGSVEKIIVSDWLKNPDRFATLKDTTNLSDIVNVKGNESFNVSDKLISFEADGKDIYYQGSLNKDTALPVSLKITYDIDGTEVSSDAIEGKSGKLTMTIEYTPNEKTSDDIYVPFLAATGILLPTENFRNVAVENGQVLSNGDYNIVVGMGLPGISENLGLDIPNTVTVTADVTDYNVDMMMTVVTNKIFSDASLDEEVDLSDITDMVSLLSESSVKLSDGAKSLYDGLTTLQEKSGDLAAGITKLNNGAATIDSKMNELSAGAASLYSGISTQLLPGATKLNGGLNQLSNGAAQLSNGVNQLASSVNTMVSTIQKSISDNNANIQSLTNLIKGIQAGDAASLKVFADKYGNDINNIKTQIAGLQGANTALTTLLTQLTAADSTGATMNDKLNALVSGTKTLEAGINEAASGSKTLADSINTTLAPGAKQLSDGSAQLSAGASELAAGIAQLNSQIPALTEGIKALCDGSKELSDGMSQFNESAIQKIAELYNNDFGAVADELKKTVEAGQSYTTLTGTNETGKGTATFIIKTK